MGRAIKMEAKIDTVEAQIEVLKGRVNLIEKAIAAGIKKPAKKTRVKKPGTIMEQIEKKQEKEAQSA